MRSTVVIALALLSIPGLAAAFECTVCHSKNPAMVKMHTAVRGQGCFGCHKVGDKLMGKKQPKDRESLLLRRQTDQVCIPCHVGKAQQP